MLLRLLHKVTWRLAQICYGLLICFRYSDMQERFIDVSGHCNTKPPKAREDSCVIRASLWHSWRAQSGTSVCHSKVHGACLFYLSWKPHVPGGCEYQLPISPGHFRRETVWKGWQGCFCLMKQQVKNDCWATSQQFYKSGFGPLAAGFCNIFS